MAATARRRLLDAKGPLTQTGQRPGMDRMIPCLNLPDALSLADCDRLLGLIGSVSFRPAGLVGQVTNDDIRRADVVWLDDLAGTGWVMDRLVALVSRANREAYGFDLDGFEESAQVARYDAARRGHFDWHSDIGAGALARRRKLTVVLQLSDPGGYDGGALEIRPDSAVQTAKTARGTGTIFPSFALHRVTPVTRGERYSLTLWAHGPAFR